MTLLQAILMGIIQGVTEFLPVSSSGHLALFKNLFDVNTDTGILFDILLHIGTLLAVCIVYYQDVLKMITEFFGMVADCFTNLKMLITGENREIQYIKVVRNSYRKMALMIIVSTIPTGIIGIVSSELAELSSQILFIPGIGLVITSILLFIADRLPEGTRTPKKISYTNAFIIGICQGIATLPGVSRSGTTITACLASGFKRSFAVKYSFLMSLPAILGSLVFELNDIGKVALSTADIASYIVGMLVAAVVGYICIKVMLLIVKNKKFTFFAIYCFLIGCVSIGGYFYIA